MALEFSTVAEVATAIESIAEAQLQLLYKIKALLLVNGRAGIDWGAATKPEYIEEDERGNVRGKNFTRQEADQGLQALDQVRELLENEKPVQGDHAKYLVNVAVGILR